jgi:hypothetical protein
MHSSVPSYSDALVDTTQEFHDTTTRLPDKRLYQMDNLTDMEELSIRFMGVSGERLKHTMLISTGLMENTGTSTATGGSARNVRANLFPQGNMKTNRPHIYKGQLQKLHKASIAEVVFTDTFEVDDSLFRYAWASVCVLPVSFRTNLSYYFT